MKIINNIKYIAIVLFCVVYSSCKLPTAIQAPTLKTLPTSYNQRSDTTNSAQVAWREFFQDKNLVALLDTAIRNNPEVLITLQHIQIAQNQILMRQGALRPMVKASGGLGLDKVGRYTSQGAGDASADITPGRRVPEVLPDILGGVRTSWEVDIWGKLKSAKSAAMAQYMASNDGKNFVVTNLVAEVANSYYELLALDNQLDIIQKSIELQKNQLELVKVQKQAAVVTELAVKQFEAHLLNTQSMEYEVIQNITEMENKINFLLGRYPQPIVRDKATLMTQVSPTIQQGIPTQLLKNRPDIRQAKQEILATKWELKTAQLEFYPSLELSSGLGLQSFSPAYLYRLPESLIASVIGDLAGTIINRDALTAEFQTANAQQIQAMYEYQKTILNASLEVSNALAHIDNLQKRYNFKNQQVEIATQSIGIANDLFKSARANYLEVLNVQAEALETNLEVIEIKKQQFNATINAYRALGGGWK